mmetsp:Transcript_45379/g.150452  ORF Transcript_45379/g.150452 Transcript_45379/m.150452 type:complete len:262 (-) Transcript_45379:680-1465(-)
MALSNRVARFWRGERQPRRSRLGVPASVAAAGDPAALDERHKVDRWRRGRSGSNHAEHRSPLWCRPRRCRRGWWQRERRAVVLAAQPGHVRALSRRGRARVRPLPAVHQSRCGAGGRPPRSSLEAVRARPRRGAVSNAVSLARAISVGGAAPVEGAAQCGSCAAPRQRRAVRLVACAALRFDDAARGAAGPRPRCRDVLRRGRAASEDPTRSVRAAACRLAALGRRGECLRGTLCPLAEPARRRRRRRHTGPRCIAAGSSW